MRNSAIDRCVKLPALPSAWPLGRAAGRRAALYLNCWGTKVSLLTAAGGPLRAPAAAGAAGLEARDAAPAPEDRAAMDRAGITLTIAKDME